MGRDDLYITVPSFFQCPISLDVMKSPVSLPTGVTYDRTNIQRWLDGGNNTCPATMQVLQTKDLVPNHTLQRLIQIWSDSVKSRPPTTEPSGPNSVTHQEVKSLLLQLKTILSSSNTPFPITIVSRILDKLILFAKNSEENLKIFSSELELPRLILANFSTLSKNVQQTQKLLQVVYLILKSPHVENELNIVNREDLVESLVLNLVKGRAEERVLAMRVLKTLADLSDDCKHIMGENDELYVGLLRLIREAEATDQDLEHSLMCLIAIAMPKKNRFRLVRGGAVAIMAKALSETEANHSLVEKMLKLLEMMNTCKEGRGEICGDEKCVEAIVRKLLKVSNVATEHAVTILWSLCCLFRDKKAQESVGKSNGMAKILLLLQSNVSPAIRQMCTDLLKVFRVSSKSSCLSCYDTKTTHIMPF